MHATNEGMQNTVSNLIMRTVGLTRLGRRNLFVLSLMLKAEQLEQGALGGARLPLHLRGHGRAAPRLSVQFHHGPY